MKSLFQVTKGPNSFTSKNQQLPPRSPEREAWWKEMKKAKYSLEMFVYSLNVQGFKRKQRMYSSGKDV
jgi:hypothetical protein